MVNVGFNVGRYSSHMDLMGCTLLPCQALNDPYVKALQLGREIFGQPGNRATLNQLSIDLAVQGV